jgi:hypothetical protein
LPGVVLVEPGVAELGEYGGVTLSFVLPGAGVELGVEFVPGAIVPDVPEFG